jgi:drug/metabolite transporter (DMT)-like permease
VVYLALDPAAVGYVSWSIANSHLPASVAATLLAVTPVVSLLVAWPWLGEIPTLLSLGGGAITIMGVLFVNLWGRHPTP